MPYINVIFMDDEGEEYEVRVPGHWKICDRCGGDGSVVNPNIGAITSEEWERDWSPEEQEWYLSGVYNVECRTCTGTGKVVVPLGDHLLTEEQRNALRVKEERRAMDIEDMRTMRMEMGWWDR